MGKGVYVMKVNLCKCGILKNVKSDQCSVCLKASIVQSGNSTKAVNKAKIKAANQSKVIK